MLKWKVQEVQQSQAASNPKTKRKRKKKKKKKEKKTSLKIKETSIFPKKVHVFGTPCIHHSVNTTIKLITLIQKRRVLLANTRNTTLPKRVTAMNRFFFYEKAKQKYCIYQSIHVFAP